MSNIHTPADFADDRAILGLSLIELGRLLRFTGEEKTVECKIRDYEKGKREISGPMSLAMDLLVAAHDLIAAYERSDRELPQMIETLKSLLHPESN